MKTLLLTAAAFVAGLAAPRVVATVAANRQPAQTPRVFMSSGGTALRVLVDAKSLGGNEVEVGELTFPANSDSGDHRHAVTETFFVLEGQLEQVVNGKPVALGPGGIVSIRSTDQVRHKSGPNGAKVLVIWAPGGEIDRVTARWKVRETLPFDLSHLRLEIDRQPIDARGCDNACHLRSRPGPLL